jgi:hypothetical protein
MTRLPPFEGVEQTTDGMNRSVPRDSLQPRPLSINNNRALEERMDRWLVFRWLVFRRWARRNLFRTVYRPPGLRVGQTLKRRRTPTWERLVDGHMKHATLEHRWERILRRRGGGVRDWPVRQLSTIWRARPWHTPWRTMYMVLFSR